MESFEEFQSKQEARPRGEWAESKKLGMNLFVFCVVVGFALWAVQSYFEARAYENVTGRHVSMWDAMFIELRVQEGPR